jgi:HEAT repeat protein
MDRPEFDECIEMLRSDDPMTFEDGYHWLQGHLNEHVDDLIALMLREADPQMRGRFVELLGDSQNERAIPYLEGELHHEESEVRSWAYSALLYFENEHAKSIAERFRREHPDEEFL